jgi:DNA modification methylase
VNKDAYQEFLERKVAIAEQSGLEVGPLDVNPICKPHQRDCILWAVRGGRRALFESFGLGKTIQQLEILRIILEKSGGGHALIVCPLGVRQEFIRDAGMLGTPVTFIRTNDEVQQLTLIGEKPKIFITNYESVRDGKLDPRQFKAVSLDEAGILRGFGGTKTFREFMRMFEGTSTYRFVATATPSPNEFIELLSYAAFLDVMDVGQAKTRFFKRDATRADHLTIHPHKQKEFWLWVASWAMFLQKPSDLGYSDDGYELPPLDVRWHEIPTNHANAGFERDGQGRLIQETTISVSNAAREKRDSLPARIEKLMELRAEDPSAHRVIWHDLEAERHAIERAADTPAVFGAQDLDEREHLIVMFSNGTLPELAAKPVMLGSGTNLQRHCSWEIFLGISFKFNDFIQATHRVHRFLQENQVRIDIIYTEAEREVRKQLERKWEQHNILVEEMSKIIREYGLAREAMAMMMRRSIGCERVEENGRDWKLVNNDSVIETRNMETDSVDLILTSIPFSTQYEYSPSYNDFGHNEDTDSFWQQMDFLTPELLRLLKPGRICAIHVKDRITPGGITGLGYQVVSPLHAEAIFHYRKHGLGYLGMKTITTDVVRENNQTYRLGWTEQCKDGTKMGVGMPEYLLLFRKAPTDNSDGYADIPVIKEKPFCDDHGVPAPFDSRSNWKQPLPGTGYSRARWQMDAHGYARSSGDRLLTPEELRNSQHEKLFKLWRDRSTNRVYDFEGHVGVAEDLDYLQRLPATFMLFPPHSWHSDVWTDVTRMRTLNGAQSAKGKELHLCPIQFDLVERVIRQFTMAGETVFDPFVGLGTVPMMAVKMGRRGIGIELSPAYFADSLWYLRNAEMENDTPTLFDMLDAEAELVELEPA